MDKLTAIKIKYDDGTYSDEIPVSVLSENVEWDSTHTLIDVLGSIDVDVTGTIQDQISQLFNEKISVTQLQNYVASQLSTDVTNWLNTNVNPVGSAVVVDSSLTIQGAAADAKAAGSNLSKISFLENRDVYNNAIKELYLAKGFDSNKTYTLAMIAKNNPTYKYCFGIKEQGQENYYLARTYLTDVENVWKITSNNGEIIVYAVIDWSYITDNGVKALNDVITSKAYDVNFSPAIKAQLIADSVEAVADSVEVVADSVAIIADSEEILLYSGRTQETYTSSTFSGFASSYQNESKKTINSLSFSLRSRDTVNISKIKVRIESDDGTSIFENAYDVNVGTTKQKITVPVSFTMPTGRIWFAVAANKIATFDHDEVSSGNYTYWTYGNIDDLTNLRESGSSTHPLALSVGVITQAKINDKQVTQDNLSFSEFIEPKNLLNIDDEDQCKIGWWYYSTTIGNIIAPKDLKGQYTYTALKAKTYGGEKITIDTYPRQAQPPSIYWVGAADKNMRLLSYSIVNHQVPVTYTVPEGTVYILASPGTKSEAVLKTMMIVKSETVTEYIKGEGEKYLLKNCIAEINKEENKYEYLMLPDNYNLVVGDTFQLFKKGIVNAVNPDIYDVRFVCSKGTAYEKFYEITPTAAETLLLNVLLYGEKHELLESKSVDLVIRSKKTSLDSKKYVLCVGDSLTTAGIWPKELHRRLTAIDGTPQGDGLTNIEFIGSRVYNNVNYEGYGGWTFNSYNTENVNTNTKIITCSHDKIEAEDQHSIYKDGTNATWKLETIESGQIKIIAVSSEGRNFPATGTLIWVSGGTHHSDIVYTASQNAAGNPFWDSSQNKVDFAAYCSRLNVPRIDYVVVLLGWNSASSSEANYKENTQTFINNVLASYPDAKILLMGLQIPARDGLGANYGANGTYAYYYGLMQYIFNLDNWYEDLADGVNVYHINLAGQFDTEHNMPTAVRQVNIRNSKTETYQSNGVHPSIEGSMQIADAAYRFLESVF